MCQIPKTSNYPDQSQNLLRYFDAGTYHHNGHHHRNNADTLRAIGESFLTGSDVAPQTIPQGRCSSLGYGGGSIPPLLAMMLRCQSIR